MRVSQTPRLRYRRVPAPPGMSGFWSTLATGGSSLLQTGTTLYQTREATKAAEAASAADIETARAALQLAQSEVERARIEQEIAQMEAENRAQFVGEVGKVAVPLVLGGAALIYFLRKKKGRR